MNEILRKEIWRKLESLPDDKAYQVLDYINYLQSQYGAESTTSGFQRFGEIFQDTMRKRRVPASAMRETMKVMGAARAVGSGPRRAAVRTAGDRCRGVAPSRDRSEAFSGTPARVPGGSPPPVDGTTGVIYRFRFDELEAAAASGWTLRGVSSSHEGAAGSRQGARLTGRPSWRRRRFDRL
jgi:hypothetical protein